MNILGKKSDAIPLTGCLAVTVLVYLPALAKHLVADDWVFIMPHSFFETLGYFFTSIIPPEWYSLWLRPVPMLFFWLDSVFWPGTEWGPHLINIIFHLCNIILIWSIMRFILSRSSGSQDTFYAGCSCCVACLLYGMHPLGVGSIAWVAARFDVMSVTFGLAAMLMWMKWDAGISGVRALAGSLVFSILCILSKEQGIIFIAICFIISLLRSISSFEERKKHLKGLVLLGSMVMVYAIYRLIVFNGIGGYLTARHGFSIRPPMSYLAALLFPYLNPIPGWTFSWTFFGAVFIVGLLILYLWKTTKKTVGKIDRIYILTAAILFIFGLATTAPHPELTFEAILDHAESRFALIAITGFSLLTGIAVAKLTQKPHRFKMVLVLLGVWTVISAWRTDVQIQAWKQSGNIAHSIIQETLEQTPDPPPNSSILFFDIPRNNDQFAYIFGIGLKEALLLNYDNRDDITIIRYPKRKDLRAARPGIDSVFRYNVRTGKLEKLHAPESQKKL
ncbi:hypothetical protein ACFL1R_09085 [Candidatus Latescibacterota bacterium]